MISCADTLRIHEIISRRLESDTGGYVCFSNVHTVVTAHRDDKLREITNNSLVTAADGKPLYIVGRMCGHECAGHVPGPDFMQYLLAEGGKLRHYFYGSTQSTLDALINNITERYPQAVIVGAYSPPFLESRPGVSETALENICRVRPDIVWVGLGAPKQEYWMSRNWKKLRPAILMGVGAAFDFHAGTKKRAPFWYRKLGMEWLYRLCQEPARLWRRYTVTNTLFLYYVGKRFLSKYIS
jgi:N-acetylglucosaminyldiphosphoundecaprenol N-acetyl-beta-D-mannosaminyltransferase